MLVVIVISIMSFASISSATTTSDIVHKLKSSKILKIYVTQAESYLHSRNISSVQADKIMALIDEVLATTGDKIRLSQLNSRQKLAILEYFTEAGQVLDLEVVYDDGDIIVTDKDNKQVFYVNKADIIKQTGYNYDIALYGMALLLLAGLAGVTTRKVLVTTDKRSQ
jgi:competence protein ComGC